MKNLHRYLHHWNRQWSTLQDILTKIFIAVDQWSCFILLVDHLWWEKLYLWWFFNFQRKTVKEIQSRPPKDSLVQNFPFKIWLKTHPVRIFYFDKSVGNPKNGDVFTQKKCSHGSTFKRIKCINILVEADIEEREYNGSEIGHFRLASQIGKSRFLLSPKELSAEEAHFIYGWFYIRCLSQETPPLLPLDSLLSEIFIFLLAFVWGDKKSEFPFRKWKEMETWYNFSFTDPHCIVQASRKSKIHWLHQVFTTTLDLAMF